MEQSVQVTPLVQGTPRILYMPGTVSEQKFAFVDKHAFLSQVAGERIDGIYRLGKTSSAIGDAPTRGAK